MLIRPARMDDTPGMARVIVDTFMWANEGLMSAAALQQRRAEWTYDVSARAWAETLAEIAEGRAPGCCVYVAEDAAGEVVGLAYGCPAQAAAEQEHAHVGEVDVLYVRVSHHGQGIGRNLVQAVAAYLAECGMTQLHIATVAASRQARGFYEALGGRVVGTREDEDHGDIIPLVVYGWEDIRVLLPA
jgi:L-amino acid N-acyltransferase YncA